MTELRCEGASCPTPTAYDVVVVGGGMAGPLVAKVLGQAGYRVLILESGAGLQPNNNEYLQRFYQAAFKVPESPYTPELHLDGKDSGSPLLAPANLSAPRPTVLSLLESNWRSPDQSYFIQTGCLPFGSTYERIAGGTARHWLGISLRHLPNDFTMADTYNNGKSSDWPSGLVNWPAHCRYKDLEPWYLRAEDEIGVAADDQEQTAFSAGFGVRADYKYPMPGIPRSRVDDAFAEAFKTFPPEDGVRLAVTGTPAARNSQPFRSRRVCAGNTNCIPICPIQAKYDPTITLHEALNTGHVDVLYQAVACDVQVAENGTVAGIRYLCYAKERRGKDSEQLAICEGVAKGKIYVLAANAIETPRLLLMSNGRKGVANGPALGGHLMDHPYYVAFGLTKNPVYPYRGPLETSGIEVMRDGPFRRNRGAFRVDISNDGWSLKPNGDLQHLVLDFLLGINRSQLNPKCEVLSGTSLVRRLNALVTRQLRLGFLVEQTPDLANRVSLSDKFQDGLGLPRPEIKYDISDYTKRGLAASADLASRIFKHMGATEYSNLDAGQSRDPCTFEWSTGSSVRTIKYLGAGHIVGTCRMGEDPKTSVVNPQLQAWGHANLYVTGSSVFPTVATANPTLTLAALSLRLADALKAKLKSPG